MPQVPPAALMAASDPLQRMSPCPLATCHRCGGARARLQRPCKLDASDHQGLLPASPGLALRAPTPSVVSGQAALATTTRVTDPPVERATSMPDSASYRGSVTVLASSRPGPVLRFGFLHAGDAALAYPSAHPEGNAERGARSQIGAGASLRLAS